MRRADRWAQGLLLALLGLVLGTIAVLLVGPRPCPERAGLAPSVTVPPDVAPDEVDELTVGEVSGASPGESVADDTWGSLGP